jgi:hypothetical protein
MFDQIQPMMFMMLSSMKNSNQSYITEILTILVLILPYITKIIPFEKLKDSFENYINKNNNYISINISSHEVPVIRSSSTTLVTKLLYSKNFLSIIHYIINNKIKNLNSLTEIMTSNTELDIRSYSEQDKSDNKFMFMPLSKEKILISEDEQIYFEINNDKKDNEDNDKNTTKIITKNKFIIILSISNKFKDGMNILENFIKKCRDDYDFFNNKNKDDNKQYIFEFKNSEKSESTIELKYKQYLMEHNKDLMINIFFENKDRLINYIKPFIYDPFEKHNSGEEKYKRSGFTFKAGILFYGSPGCGKTSTIKAILKYTNRHGVIINLNRVKTCEELELIFRNRSINEKEMNGKQLCYILEDCDAFNDDIIKSRKINEEDFKKNSTDSETSQLTKLFELGTSTVKNIIKNEEDSLNLSCFLNILDGIIELHGVMIIMTTNHPEKIDEALIRPGRFDFKYEFKKASKNIVKEMLKFKFELSDDEMEKHSNIMNIKDKIFSPAEIQSICFKNDNIIDCIQEIILTSQKK